MNLTSLKILPGVLDVKSQEFITSSIQKSLPQENFKIKYISTEDLTLEIILLSDE
jgi:hypothetical protein